MRRCACMQQTMCECFALSLRAGSYYVMFYVFICALFWQSAVGVCYKIASPGISDDFYCRHHRGYVAWGEQCVWMKHNISRNIDTCFLLCCRKVHNKNRTFFLLVMYICRLNTIFFLLFQRKGEFEYKVYKELYRNKGSVRVILECF